jgi:hypothetical protein
LFAIPVCHFCKVTIASGDIDENSKGINSKIFLAGRRYFEVKEIELIEIIDDCNRIGNPPADRFPSLLVPRLISGFPNISAEFERRKFSLLW